MKRITISPLLKVVLIPLDITFEVLAPPKLFDMKVFITCCYGSLGQVLGSKVIKTIPFVEGEHFLEALVRDWDPLIKYV